MYCMHVALNLKFDFAVTLLIYKGSFTIEATVNLTKVSASVMCQQQKHWNKLSLLALNG